MGISDLATPSPKATRVDVRTISASASAASRARVAAHRAGRLDFVGDVPHSQRFASPAGLTLRLRF